MKKSLVLCAVLLSAVQVLPAQNAKNGYYKDLFMDSGIAVSTFPDLPAAKMLGLSMERICTYEAKDTSAATAYERSLMKNTFVGSPLDENGPLLYPDGAPRFRAIYINGGKATAHGIQLTPAGLETIRKFYANGGSYVGTCAGAFISSKGVYAYEDNTFSDNDKYLGIFPGYTVSTHLEDSYTTLTLGKKSPLLKYYDFGGDRKLDSVRHNGGCYLYTPDAPAGTETLMSFEADTITKEVLPISIHNTVNCWAYKASDKSGRLVVTGSHPERMISGERLQMFSALLRYAMDGNGAPQIKGDLSDGAAREMVCKTCDNNPNYTRIGDRQYHHFTVNVPKGAKKVLVTLTSTKGADDFDLQLYAASDGPAFNANAKWYNVQNGVDKVMVVDNPKPGKLYVSVFCETTVDVKDTKYGEQYTGRTEVLNGVPYVISATIEK